MKSTVKDVVAYMVDCDLEMEDFEALLPYTTGELKTLIEYQLTKMDEAEAERKAEDDCDPVYEWYMECKGDQMREER